jgi:uncharacterized protein (DUF427 family)
VAYLVTGGGTMAGTPDHPIVISPAPQRVRVRFAGRTVADTVRALSLREASYPPVLYIPREDVEMSLLVRSTHKTRCPYKGEASYYSIKADGGSAENAIWTYEQPFADVAEIAGHMAFYPNRVDAIEETPI